MAGRGSAGQPARLADDCRVPLFLCCHPALTAASQTALTLRAVGGLTTAEIARAFLVPEATMAARISRAKQRIKAAGSSFSLPDGAEREERLRVVLHVLYLIFNEGYTTSSGSELDRADLAHEAIRLARMVHARLPEDGEVTGLLALMLLTHSRREARRTAAGDLVPLDEQDRATWDRLPATQASSRVSLTTCHWTGPCWLRSPSTCVPPAAGLWLSSGAGPDGLRLTSGTWGWTPSAWTCRRP